MLKLYLDWNIITSLRQIETLTSEDRNIFEPLQNVINSARDKIHIPYSNAHLNDLLKSYKKGERHRVEKSLEFISLLTQDVCLTQYWNEEFVRWHYRNSKEYFESILDDEKDINISSLDSIVAPLKEYGVDKVFDMFKLIPHNIKFDELQQHNNFYLSFFEKSKLENSMHAVMEDFINLINKMKTNPLIYNELRNVFKSTIPLDPNLHNTPNVIDTLDRFLPKTMLNKSFTQLYSDNNKNDSLKNSDYSKIIGVFMQLDFIGYGSDKLTQKNQYDNLFNDALHCFYGAHCHFFITADRKTYKKTKAVYESERISTQVMKPKEFIEYLNNL